MQRAATTDTTGERLSEKKVLFMLSAMAQTKMVTTMRASMRMGSLAVVLIDSQRAAQQFGQVEKGEGALPRQIAVEKAAVLQGISGPFGKGVL